MQVEELLKLINNIKSIKTELNNLEIKSAFKGCPEKLYDTLSSFSNQDNGGTIVFGIDEKKDYFVCGVYDVNDLIKKISEQCKQMEPPVRALFTVANYNDKKVVSAEIPGIDYYNRPCYYKGIGKYKGSYIRVGEADEQMTEYEIYSYESYKQRIKDDLRIVDDTQIKLFDDIKYNKYLTAVKEERTNLAKILSDNNINELMGISKGGKPTLAAIVVFSKYPQAYFPQYSITAVCIPGIQKGDVGTSNERFIDNRRITGPIDEMIEEGMNFIRKNIKSYTIINNLGQREDKYEYPLKAIREALLNSLVHRDYSRYTEGIPVSLEIYSDRIEITNPGVLFGGISVEQLGIARPETRNIILSNILELLHITENRYSGIPTIRKELLENNMPAPIFISKNGQFKTIIKKSFDDNSNSYNEKVISFCHIPRSRDEIVAYLGLSRNHVISQIIQPLVEKGELLLTIPEKPKSSLQKYYSKIEK
ncbi:MAG: ATP-binding protein [Bacilli bacterium]